MLTGRKISQNRHLPAEFHPRSGVACKSGPGLHPEKLLRWFAWIMPEENADIFNSF